VALYQQWLAVGMSEQGTERKRFEAFVSESDNDFKRYSHRRRSASPRSASTANGCS
jgi:hypothetical protein